MYKISKTFSFCYGHRLLNDTGKCRHLHGHTAKVSVVLSSGSLDQLGMVVHFDRLKETLGDWLSKNLDHTLLLSNEDPIAKILLDQGEKVFLMESNPTSENIAKMIFDKAKEFKLPVKKVEVWESETSMAMYQE